MPHSLQNLAVGLNCAPQEPQTSPVAVSPPPPSPLGSTSVSFHRRFVMSVISPCHLRHELLRPSAALTRIFETLVCRLFRDRGSPPTPPSSWRRLGPRDMPLEAKRSRHVAVAIPVVAVASLVTVNPRQQSPQPQQPDVAQSEAELDHVAVHTVRLPESVPLSKFVLDARASRVPPGIG